MFNTNFGLVCVKEIFSEIKLLAGWIFGAWEEEKSFAREMRERVFHVTALAAARHQTVPTVVLKSLVRRVFQTAGQHNTI